VLKTQKQADLKAKKIRRAEKSVEDREKELKTEGLNFTTKRFNTKAKKINYNKTIN
jgi:hypothetical protein